MGKKEKTGIGKSQKLGNGEIIFQNFTPKMLANILRSNFFAKTDL
jgi:hypothetical protein